MQKLPFLLLITFCCQVVFEQHQLPTIKATAASVDIRVGTDYFAKGEWILDAQKKPDIFLIGSQWPYRFKKVTFSTDVDSISLNVQPGLKYDFVILLNEQTPCHIQIATLANPVFMNAAIVTLMLTGFGLIFILLYVLRRRIDALPLLYVGYAVPLIFWVVTGISGQLYGDYHHLKNVISELGAIGTKSEVFTSASFVVLAVLSTLFSIGIYKASQMLKMYWRDEKAQPFKSIGRLNAWLQLRGEQLRFAMNGGMYNADHVPVGLFIQEQKRLIPLDTAAGTGNFYLKPNGVFYTTTEGRAVVCKTEDFINRPDIAYATQSGPMLLINGQRHPAFTKGSGNRNIRNGVGILPNGHVLFAMSKKEISFYDFAEYFRRRGCRNALYLDGLVSRTYLPEQNWVQTDGDFGAIIGVVERR